MTTGTASAIATTAATSKLPLAISPPGSYLLTLSLLPPIHCRNPSTVRSKLDRIMQDGPQHLHFISDFDMTMTRYWVNGQRNLSSHGLVNRWSGCTQMFKDASDALYRKYYPIEISTELTQQEKVPHMVEWWREAHDLIIKQSIGEQDLAAMVRETPLSFRPHLRQTVELCHQLRIPFLVFSAGLADLIEEVLRYESLYLPSMHVISNRMVFDSQTRRVIGFSEPIVHVFNKNEFTGLLTSMTLTEEVGEMAGEKSLSAATTSVYHLHGSAKDLLKQQQTGESAAEKSPEVEVVVGGAQLTNTDAGRYRESLRQYRQMISNRRNVVLMGDSLGDIQMGQGVEHDCLLSVGYLNQYRWIANDPSTLSTFTSSSSTSLTSNNATSLTNASGRWVDCVEHKGPPTAQEIIDKTVQAYLNTFDVVIAGDCGFDILINPLLNVFKQSN